MTKITLSCWQLLSTYKIRLTKFNVDWLGLNLIKGILLNSGPGTRQAGLELALFSTGVSENFNLSFSLQLSSAVNSCWQVMTADDNKNQPKYGSWLKTVDSWLKMCHQFFACVWVGSLTIISNPVTHSNSFCIILSIGSLLLWVIAHVTTN